MAKKGSGAAGGTKLASGFIELSVKYGSAMGQIASDFDAIDKRAKSTGASITKNLVTGADAAKAKVQELGTAYEQQRAKVAALKSEVQQLQATRERAAAAEKAYDEASRAWNEKRIANGRQQIQLQNQLAVAQAKARSQGIPKEQTGNVAEVKAAQTALNTLNAKRKKDIQDLVRLSKEWQAAQSASGSKAGAKVQQTFNAELAKGREMYEQYGKAVQDAQRKQQLANVTTTQAIGEHRTLGQRISSAFSGTFVPQMQAAGTKGVNAFRQAFNHHMAAARSDSEHHGRNIASGLLMGLTPQFLTAAGAGLAVGAAFKTGFSRLEDIDSAKIKLQALGYTAADVTATTGAAMNSVVGTAYSFSDAMNAATASMAAGIKPGKDLEKHLTLIGNVAALTDQDYATVAETINRVTQFGVLSAREIRPLVSAKIPVYQWLRDYYVKQTGNQKITIQDIREMVTKKMISAEVFEKVVGERTAGLAKEIGRKTVTGAFKNMWVQVGKVTASMIEPIFGSIPGAINKVADTLSRWSEQLKPIMANAVTWIKKQWATLAPAMGVAVEWIKKAWANVGPALGVAIAWIKKTWAELWPHIKVFADQFVAMWKEMWPQLVAHIRPFMEAVHRLWDAASPILKGLGLFAGWIAYEFIKHLPAFSQFATNLVNWLATAVDWMRTEFWPWLKNHWAWLVEQVGGAVDAVKTFASEIGDRFQMAKDATLPIFAWFEERFTMMKESYNWFKDRKDWFFGPDGPIHNPFGMGTANADTVPFNAGKPAGLIDSGHVASGPQSNFVAGQVLSRFPGIKSINGSYLPMSEGGPSVPGTHDAGLSIDIPIGPSAGQRAEGDRINAFLQANAKLWGINYTIWKDVGRNAKDNPSGAEGTTFGQGGHQNHIDVHFDGKTFRGLDPAAGGPQNAVVAGSTNPLWDKIAQAESAGKWDDNNSGNNSTSSGAPRGGLQITDGTWKAFGGEEFASHANEATKAEQIIVAKRIAFQGYKGTGPQGLSAWDTVKENKVAGVHRSMTAADFGGITNLSVEKPFGPSVTDILLGNAANPTGGGTVQVPSVAGAILGNSLSTGPAGGIAHMPTVSDILLGNTAQPTSATGLTIPSIVSQLGPWPGGIPGATVPGPKGTKDDPQHTVDDQVAENTDPANQPSPPSGSSDPNAFSDTRTPHEGTGAPPGSDQPEPGSKDSTTIKDAVTGLGDVASKAFSDQFAGTPFSDPTQWPATQSAGALLKFFGGLLTGSAGEGLGAFFPGGAGGKGPSDKQSRHAVAAYDKKNAQIAKEQAVLDEMANKPQFLDEDIQAQQDKVDQLKADRDMMEADARDSGINLTGAAPVGNGGGLLGGLGNLFPGLNIGSPPPAPGGPVNGGSITPGGGNVSGVIPDAMNPAALNIQPSASPAQRGDVNITTNQQITGDPAQATDVANRNMGTTLRSPLLNLQTV